MVTRQLGDLRGPGSPEQTVARWALSACAADATRAYRSAWGAFEA